MGYHLTKTNLTHPITKILNIEDHTYFTILFSVASQIETGMLKDLKVKVSKHYLVNNAMYYE